MSRLWIKTGAGKISFDPDIIYILEENEVTVKTMDALLVKKCFLSGAAAIQIKKEYINELNVFPVPDGDTGTNMAMTIQAAANEVAAIENPVMEDICKAISGGSLRGARGNSGVILSQLLRGFTKVVRQTDKITISTLVQGFEKAVDSAYKAVMKPKEGTILTVARGGAEKAAKIAKECDDIADFAGRVIEEMRRVLDQTPEMLPVLKEAGVVDSGGEGLVTILEGMRDALLGKEIVYDSAVQTAAGNMAEKRGASAEGISTEEIKFGYCTEFIIRLDRDFSGEDEAELKAYLEGIGDSIVCVADEDIVKIHVHTNDPGLAIQKGLSYGELSRMKIDNMREEHNERVILSSQSQTGEVEPAGATAQTGASGQQAVPAQEGISMQKGVSVKEGASMQQGASAGVTAQQGVSGQQAASVQQETPRKAVGFISVSAGDGLSTIFSELGVDVVIEGGQTMNPSTEDILEAVSKVNADTIYIFPNNSNIVLAANQAKELTEDKDIIVIPTKNIPQGITAMLHYVDGNSSEENEETMTEAIRHIKSGQITYAVRDTSIDGKEIKQGDIMGLSDKTIETVGSSIKETTVEFIRQLMDEETELITLYYGKESTEEEAEEIAGAVREQNGEIEVEVEYGGQPVYYYFISLE